jgi:hypothetical protein
LFWSCKLYQLNPKVDSQVKTLLTKLGAEYEYKKFAFRDREDTLKVHIFTVQKNQFGVICQLDLDRIVYLENREEGRFPVKVTQKLDVQIFEIPALPNYVGVFASDRISTILFTAMTTVLREQTGEFTVPFLETYFRLKEKEKELQSYFDNLTEISVDGVRDSFVRKARFKGSFLAESEVYQKYVKDKDIAGDIEFFGVSVDGRTIVLVSEGVIYTRQGSDRGESLKTVVKCVANIQKADALRSVDILA